MTQTRTVPVTVDAVIITRNRIDLLRKTLQSIQNSSYPVRSIFVTDDSTDLATKEMLAAEFPQVVHFIGPKRGISANRNSGTRHSDADYILLSDDDMLVDPTFVRAAIEKAQLSGADLVFTATQDDGVSILPNTLGFLGFSDVPYRLGKAYNTANLQCFVLSRTLAKNVVFDEIISTYGYEEMDYSYRVVAAGFSIECVPTCVNVHLDPNAHLSFRAVQDAGRLYVTYKRASFIDKKPLRAFAFRLLAVPHHFLASIKRDGVGGITIAANNMKLAYQMYGKYRQLRRAGEAQITSEQSSSNLSEAP